MLELGLNRDAAAVYVHRGGCWNAAKRSRGVTRDAALQALAATVDENPEQSAAVLRRWLTPEEKAP